MCACQYYRTSMLLAVPICNAHVHALLVTDKWLAVAHQPIDISLVTKSWKQSKHVLWLSQLNLTWLCSTWETTAQHFQKHHGIFQNLLYDAAIQTTKNSWCTFKSTESELYIDQVSHHHHTIHYQPHCTPHIAQFMFCSKLKKGDWQSRWQAEGSVKYCLPLCSWKWLFTCTRDLWLGISSWMDGNTSGLPASPSSTILLAPSAYSHPRSKCRHIITQQVLGRQTLSKHCALALGNLLCHQDGTKIGVLWGVSCYHQLQGFSELFHSELPCKTHKWVRENNWEPAE